MVQFCPLCEKPGPGVFWVQSLGKDALLYGNRGIELTFFQCPECQLIFKDPDFHLEADAEKARYLTHNNDLADPGYREYLLRLLEPLSGVGRHALGLDYGSGPTEGVKELMAEKQVACVSYDPYFFPEESVFLAKYDFVACSEAAEHFYRPQEEFQKIFGVLKEGGSLVLRTGRVPENFQAWWYHRDPTHVCFYSDRTIDWISKKYGRAVQFRSGDISVIQ